MDWKRVLMVEGVDDMNVAKHICGAWELGKIDVIRPYDGKDQLIEGIGPRLKESEIHALGILVDADTDIEARWSSIKARLEAAGYVIPEQPAADGTVVPAPIDSLYPRVGVWLMPNNSVPGILEDFLQFLIPPGDELFGHVNASVDAIPIEQRRFRDLDLPKVTIHTWLAWQVQPGRPYGTAISARFLDPQLPMAALFANWLRRTFFQEPIPH